LINNTQLLTSVPGNLTCTTIAASTSISTLSTILTNSSGNVTLSFDGSNLLVNGSAIGTTSEQLLHCADRVTRTVLANGPDWAAQGDLSGTPAVHEFIFDKKYTDIEANAISEFTEPIIILLNFVLSIYGVWLIIDETWQPIYRKL
jgi:hypothetical protein